MNTNTIDHQLKDLFETQGIDLERIDRIMDRIEKENIKPLASELTFERKRKNRLNQQVAAAIIACVLLFTPFGGQSFASSVYEWAKETIILTQKGSLTVVDESISIDQALPSIRSMTYTSEAEMIQAMGDYSFTLPTIPLELVFNESDITVYGDAPYESTVHTFKYAQTHQGFNVDSNEPMFVIDVSFHNQKKYDADAEISTRISSPGVKSTKIAFLDFEALLLERDNLYTIALPGITKDLSDTMSREISLAVSYKNIDSGPLWEEAIRVLEAIYLQYAE